MAKAGLLLELVFHTAATISFFINLYHRNTVWAHVHKGINITVYWSSQYQISCNQWQFHFAMFPAKSFIPTSDTGLKVFLCNEK